jgi:hypothetical protein
VPGVLLSEYTCSPYDFIEIVAHHHHANGTEELVQVNRMTRFVVDVVIACVVVRVRLTL